MEVSGWGERVGMCELVIGRGLSEFGLEVGSAVWACGRWKLEVSEVERKSVGVALRRGRVGYRGTLGGRLRERGWILSLLRERKS